MEKTKTLNATPADELAADTYCQNIDEKGYSYLYIAGKLHERARNEIVQAERDCEWRLTVERVNDAASVQLDNLRDEGLSLAEDLIQNYSDACDRANLRLEQIEALQAKSKALCEALENWLAFEDRSIEKDGPYAGKEIMQLIRDAREALAKFREEG